MTPFFIRHDPFFHPTNSIVQAALTNEWLDKQGVPNLQNLWIAYHYPTQTTPSTEVSANP